LLLMLRLHDGFRELFLTVVAFVLFRGVVLALPSFRAMLVAASSRRADVTPGPGTWLSFGLWWAFALGASPALRRESDHDRRRDQGQGVRIRRSLRR